MNTQLEWIAKLPSETIFTAFDTETTGLDPKQNRVIEIGALQFDQKGIISRFSTLINPGIKIPPEATKINNITDSMLKNQPKPETVFPDFLYFIHNSILVAHNASFDISFVNEELQRLNKTKLTNKVIDTLVLTKQLFPKLPKYALQELAKTFSITTDNAHRAEDDSFVCMKLFFILMDAIHSK